MKVSTEFLDGSHDVLADPQVVSLTFLERQVPLDVPCEVDYYIVTRVDLRDCEKADTPFCKFLNNRIIVNIMEFGKDREVGEYLPFCSLCY